MPSGVVDPWCPSCGDEFQPHMTICPDCEVALRTDAPPAPASAKDVASTEPAGPAPVRGSTVIDLADLTPDTRRTISLMLRGEEIFHEWRGTNLSYPTAHGDTVTEIIEWASPSGGELRPARPSEWDPDGAARRRDETLVLAARRARLGAAVLDSIIESMALTAVVLMAWVLGGRGQAVPRPVLLLVWAAVLVYRFVATGEFGQTAGKYLLGIKVIAAGGEPIGWGQAVIRVFAPWTFLMAWGQVPSPWLDRPVLAPVVWTVVWLVGVAYVLPILWDPYCRGLHDRLAGTIVVRSR
ncbi:MAG: RDD family protein [Acidimicrobiales bacterium]